MIDRRSVRHQSEATVLGSWGSLALSTSFLLQIMMHTVNHRPYALENLKTSARRIPKIPFFVPASVLATSDQSSDYDSGASNKVTVTSTTLHTICAKVSTAHKALRACGLMCTRVCPPFFHYSEAPSPPATFLQGGPTVDRRVDQPKQNASYAILTSTAATPQTTARTTTNKSDT